MKIKRSIAYLIDFVILNILYFSITISKQIEESMFNINELNNQFLEKNINFDTYFDQFITYNYELSFASRYIIGLSLIIIIIYFIIVPLFIKGQTIGMFITKIKVENPKMFTLFKRSLIIHFSGFLLINIALINTLSEIPYFYADLILTILSLLLVITSGFMVLYRQDEKGLQDVLTKSTVIKK